jgi:hypothetical protein
VIGPKVAKPTAREESEAYELVTLRDQDICQRCLRDCGPAARDHRKNRSQGGVTVVEGLQVLGLDCHVWKTDHPDAANRAGWGVPGWADPAEYPARRWVRTAVGTRRLAWVLYLPVEAWPTAWRPEDTYREIGAEEAADRIAGLRKGTD